MKRLFAVLFSLVGAIRALVIVALIGFAPQQAVAGSMMLLGVGGG